MKERVVLGDRALRQYLQILPWGDFMSWGIFMPVRRPGSGYGIVDHGPIDPDRYFNRDHDRGENFL